MADPRKAIVVGGGPVGCLAALALAKEGWNVEVYEGRPDLRLPSSRAESQQRSVNLAISSRGIAAVKVVSSPAAERILSVVMPVRARMIHHLSGRQESQQYDRYGDCINSIARTELNVCLLEDATAAPNVQVFFKHKALAVDLEEKFLEVQDMEARETRKVPFDLCIGADGSHSIVRRHLMRLVRMDYQQTYIPHEYLELRMPAGPPDASGEPTFRLDPHRLHIWPRHTFMLMALPNQDKTFTCTLFAPTAEFDRLSTPETIIAWFKTHFPDALQMIGEELLLEDFKHPRSSLITIKSKPYHYKDRALILGDAAHAMVPFYGQGLNCGLEDVRVLDILLREAGVDPMEQIAEGKEDQRLGRALSKYTDTRHEDLVAISELAMKNYVEMRHDVVTPSYLIRRTLDNILYALASTRVTLDSLIPVLSRVTFPQDVTRAWLPQYTMVTFRPDISYSTVQRRTAKQTRILRYAVWVSGTTAVGITCVAALRRLSNRA